MTVEITVHPDEEEYYGYYIRIESSAGLFVLVDNENGVGVELAERIASLMREVE